MDIETRRLLELAGLLRRRTPDHLLAEGDEEGGDDAGEDPFADDSADDEGDDDPFGGDDEGDDDPSDDAADGDGPGANRVPPEELSTRDIQRFGSPTFSEVESKLQGFFNASMTSASVGAQELETYPGVALIPQDEDETPAMDAKEKNESLDFKRDKVLILEAMRLLNEAEQEGAASDEFDMENFARTVADYMENIHNTTDIEGGIFNGARQIILNNFGHETEEEFCQMLAAIDPKWDFKGTYTDVEPQAPAAIGASSDAAGG